MCIKICRRVDSKNYLELFQVAWLSIRELEIRNPEFSANDHRAYFKTVVRRTHARGYANYSKDRTDDPIDHQDEENSGFEWCAADLEEWCEKKTDDDDDMFYRELLTLHHRCRFNRDAIELTGMTDDNFYKHLKIAKQRFKDDLIASRNIDDDHRDSLV